MGRKPCESKAQAKMSSKVSTKKVQDISGQNFYKLNSLKYALLRKIVDNDWVTMLLLKYLR